MDHSCVPDENELCILQTFLNYGRNEIEYRLTSDPTKKVESTVYFWNYNENIVIVDVDGTVTRSDVLGHVLPRIGVSYWAQDDVASLMTNIAKNGYKILYLTCRNIGYAWKSKEYVLSIKQEQKFSMPDGPLVLSPNRLWKQLFDEVVVKKPEVFKIACR